MAINFGCKCGEALEIDDQYAGMQVQCPSCQALVTAPTAAPTRVTRVTAARPLTPPLAGPRPSAPRPVEDDEGSSRKPQVVEDEEESAEDRPRRRRVAVDGDGERPRRKKRPKEVQQHQSLEGRVFSGSVMGGALAMLIAVVWFVGGLLFDILFYYPPVLFIIGLVGFIRGLMKGGAE